MNPHQPEKSLLSKASNAAVWLIILYWIADFAFTSRIGLFMFLTLMFGTGLAICGGGFINVILDMADVHSLLLSDQGWFWGLCYGIGAVLALVGMISRKII